MNTRMMTRAWDRMLHAEHVLLVNDIRIDGDTLGSSLGMRHILMEYGRRVTNLSPKPIPEAYGFLPGIQSVSVDQGRLNDPSIDLVVSFDASDGAHVVDMREKIPGRPFLVSFDHHATNPGYADLNLVDVHAPATAEVVWRFLKHNRVVPTGEAATCLLTGICTDTGIFSNPATNHACLSAASELSLHGARVQDVVRHLFANKSVDTLTLWGRALERLREHPDYGFVSTYITRDDLKETACAEDDLEGFSDFLAATIARDTVMVFRETEGGVKASLRTVSGDVARLASWFPNGGGHVKAAGFFVPGAQLREVDGRCRVVSGGEHCYTPLV